MSATDEDYRSWTDRERRLKQELTIAEGYLEGERALRVLTEEALTQVKEKLQWTTAEAEEKQRRAQSQLEQAQKNSKHYEGALSFTRQEKNLLQAKYKELTAENQALKSNRDSMKASFQKRIDEEVAKTESLREELKAKEAELREKTAEKDAEITTLRAQLEEKETELNRLRTDAAAAAAAEINEATMEMESAKVEVQDEPPAEDVSMDVSELESHEDDEAMDGGTESDTDDANYQPKEGFASKAAAQNGVSRLGHGGVQTRRQRRQTQQPPESPLQVPAKKPPRTRRPAYPSRLCADPLAAINTRVLDACRGSQDPTVQPVLPFEVALPPVAPKRPGAKRKLGARSATTVSASLSGQVDEIQEEPPQSGTRGRTRRTKDWQVSVK